MVHTNGILAHDLGLVDQVWIAPFRRPADVDLEVAIVVCIKYKLIGYRPAFRLNGLLDRPTFSLSRHGFTLPPTLRSIISAWRSAEV